jgi:hypothetical protein
LVKVKLSDYFLLAARRARERSAQIEARGRSSGSWMLAASLSLVSFSSGREAAARADEATDNRIGPYPFF